MKLYVTQEKNSKERFTVTDEQGQMRYRVEVKLRPTLRRKLLVYDMFDREVAVVQQKMVLLMRKYFVSREGKPSVEIREKWPWGQKYEVKQMNWSITNTREPYYAYETVIREAGIPIVRITKPGPDVYPRYELDFLKPADVIIAIITPIVIEYMETDEHN